PAARPWFGDRPAPHIPRSALLSWLLRKRNQGCCPLRTAYFHTTLLMVRRQFQSGCLRPFTRRLIASQRRARPGDAASPANAHASGLRLNEGSGGPGFHSAREATTSRIF